MCRSCATTVRSPRITSAGWPATRRWPGGCGAHGAACAGGRHHSGAGGAGAGETSDLLDAKDMLEALRAGGQVMTAVALATPERCDVRLVTTNVAFRKLDEAEIEVSLAHRRAA